MLRFTYRQHAEQFAAACDWLIDLGVSIDSTRASEYRALLASIAEYYETGKIDVLVERHGYPRLFNAMVEAQEFIHIHTGLIGRSDTEMLSRLREFVCGTVLLVDESPQRNQNRSRNIGFELSVAAAAARSAVPISFDSPGDLYLLTDAESLAVEYKRPFTAQRPIRLRQKFARHENRVGLPVVNDVFGLRRSCDRQVHKQDKPTRETTQRNRFK